VNAANDELDTLVVDRALQRDALSRSKAIEFDEFGSDDRSLPVVDECLPVSIRHLYLGNDVAHLASIDGEVREEVALVFVDAAKPTERHCFFHSGHGLHLLQMGHGNDETE